MSDGRTLTYGEKAVGVNFNPAQDPQVKEVKEWYAHIIDLLNDSRNATDNPESKRLYSIAITEAQAAQMWAVKAITNQF